MDYEELKNKVREYKKNADFGAIDKAYSFAERAHEGEKRLTGEPFIQHCLRVAYILADYLKADEESICAALLHDIVEDTQYKIEQLRKEFGETIANLVEGVTIFTNLKDKVASRIEYDSINLRKMLVAASRDTRVLLIKLCDKLDNMRNLEPLPEHRQKRTSREVLDIYAPLAYKLGLLKIKEELENLAFKFLYSQEYKKIILHLKNTKKERDELVDGVKKAVIKALKKENIKCEVSGRVKSLYSIYNKLVRRKYILGEMGDIFALRVIVNGVDDCYAVLKILHELWTPVPEKFKDYIAAPKPNGYRSLHTTVVGPNGKRIEFQIRTNEMHQDAECGIAAHSLYKGVVHGEDFDKRLEWLKEIINYRGGAVELIEDVKLDLFGKDIYVFTPNGDIKELPSGSTVLDFAYSVHSSLGDKCVGAHINGKFVSLRHALNNGDAVDIVTNKQQKPHRDWLKYVKTLKARSKIKQYLRGRGEIPIRGLVKEEEISKEIEESLINVEGIKSSKIKIAMCCKPIPCEKIVGIGSKTKVIIHRQDCNIIKDKKKLKAKWRESINKEIEIKVEGEDRLGFLAEIINTISSRGFSIISVKAKLVYTDIVQCAFKLNVNSLGEFVDLINRIKKLKGVKKVYVSEIKK